jgi:hypothetical protein
MMQHMVRGGDAELRARLDFGVTFLRARAADQVSHSAGSFLDHLVGVADLLVEWRQPPDICVAGLFHAVYGTEAFPRPLADPATERGEVRAVIGERAERLAWLFEQLDRSTFIPDVARGATDSIVDRTSGERRPATPDEVGALCHLLVANWLEQVPRAPVKAAPDVIARYRSLSPSLSPVAVRAIDEVVQAPVKRRRRLRSVARRRRSHR